MEQSHSTEDINRAAAVLEELQVELAHEFFPNGNTSQFRRLATAAASVEGWLYTVRSSGNARMSLRQILKNAAAQFAGASTPSCLSGAAKATGSAT